MTFKKGDVLEAKENLADYYVKGKRYVVFGDEECTLVNERGDNNYWAHYFPYDFTLVGNINEGVMPRIVEALPPADIQGNPISTGCTIAYAYGTGTLTLFEVQEVNVATATVLARAVKVGTVTTLGVLNERAIIIK